MNDHPRRRNISTPEATELVYAGDDVRDLIAARWPDAVFADASDFIHRERFEVTVPGVTQDEFFVCAIRDGWARCGLQFELALRTDPGRLRGWIDRAEQLDPVVRHLPVGRPSHRTVKAADQLEEAPDE